VPEVEHRGRVADREAADARVLEAHAQLLVLRAPAEALVVAVDLDQIVQDVLTAATGGANILVLTTWVDHLNAIAERLQASGKAATVLSGNMKARERRQITEELANRSPDAEPLLIVGTSSFIGEGFDCPALDTLFLAAPITFKNRLVQYVGRVIRPYPSKATATVHDYHDELTPVIASSLRKRAPGYIKMGFPDPRAAGR